MITLATELAYHHDVRWLMKSPSLAVTTVTLTSSIMIKKRTLEPAQSTRPERLSDSEPASAVHQCHHCVVNGHL
jgi:hypothetical protein